jgi:hypothetical protein
MRKFIFFSVLIILLSVIGYVFFSYYKVYDAGAREGILYNFSLKGTIFKTYEGVILQPGIRSAKAGGLNTNEFHFSVTDETVADSLKKCIGMQVLVHYNKYSKNLAWRGENNNLDNKEDGQYVVDKIESVKPANNAYDNF